LRCSGLKGAAGAEFKVLAAADRNRYAAEPSYNCNEMEYFPMDKFLRSVITIEKTFQIFALLGVIFFLGYVGLNSFQRDRTPSAPGISPTTQLK
jgi:hypothetical protein